MKYKIDYIKQLNGFWRFRRMNHLTHQQVDLYFALLDSLNSLFWEKELSAANSTLMKKTNMTSRSQLERARNGLIRNFVVNIIHKTTDFR